MARMMRGGSASMNMAAPISAPSMGTWPEWFAMRSTRPVGTFSTPNTSLRK